jgi:hypothetical protein
MAKERCWAGVLLLLATIGGPRVAEAVLLDFEAPEVAGAPVSLPGGTYAGDGVSFETGAISGPVVVGGTIAFAFESATFRMYEGSNAISGDQFIGADLGGGARDLLMLFSTPVTSVSLVSDATAESAHTIRLIALEALGGGNYEVLGFFEAQDNATTSPGNVLSISLPTAFSIALFEVTTEQEGFDDLEFAPALAPIPEPGMFLPLGLGLAVVAMRRLRRPNRG